MIETDFAAYDTKSARAAQLEAEILPHNKHALFEALAAAGIVVVTIEFDGYGDSGQFNEAVAFDAANNEVPIPLGDVTMKTVDFESGTIGELAATARDIIERLTYDFLEKTHPGWEDGEGAYGEFRFSLDDRTITLDYNERYIESHYHEHEF